MPRPLVLGNGSLLVTYDARGAMRDLYYPQVGLPNHLNGYRNRLGFWIEGRFAWLDEDGWSVEQSYAPEALVGLSQFENLSLGVSLTLEEGVLPSQPVLLRRLSLSNRTERALGVKIFSTHDLRIGGHDVGDTALYHPFSDSILHYKGRFGFLFGGEAGENGLVEYTTGTKGFKNFEGTWRDAEDGHLAGIPIAQGSVDSTLALRVDLNPGQSADAWLWMVCGSGMDDCIHRWEALRYRPWLDHLVDVHQYWQGWTQRVEPHLDGLPDDLASAVKVSCRIIRTQIHAQGAVIAANDSDILETARATYSYMWPRDGAFVTNVLSTLGYDQLARRFFGFCAQVLDPARPVLLHKYAPDGSLGASWHPWIVDNQPEIPLQEDESALTLAALGDWFQRSQDLEALTPLWENFARPMANFLVDFRDPKSGLPHPSWDLWEERRGIHAFTVSALIRAMRAAAELARSVGDDSASRYVEVADEVRSAMLTQMIDPESGRIWRRLEPSPAGPRIDPVVDSSTLGVALLRALEPDHPVVGATLAAVESRLIVGSVTGGVARYEGDYYWRVRDDVPGNPWIICTLWLAQVKLLRAKSAADLVEPEAWIRWALRHAAPTGVLPEQLHPDTGEALSVSPLTWSHAELIQTILAFRTAQLRLS